MKTSRRRTALGVASGAVIAAGLAAHAVGTPEAAAVSDALYAVLVYLLLGLVFVRARPWMLGVAAFGVSAVIELAQLTGLPERWSQAFPRWRSCSDRRSRRGTSWPTGSERSWSPRSTRLCRLGGDVRPPETRRRDKIGVVTKSVL